MPLNEMDKAWIRQEIQAAHKRRGWGKFTGFLKDWSGAGAAVGIAIFSATQWAGYIEFRTGTNLRLDNIEKALGQLNRSLSSLQINAHSALTADAFQSTLPELKSAFATAKKENVRVAPTVINDLQQKFLGSSQTAPDFWPAAAEFISYRSALTHEDLVNLETSMPRCMDLQPHPATTAEATSPGEQTVKINPAYYESCKIQLDSPEEDAKISYWSQTAPALTFRHCLVTYNGGVVRLQLGMWPLTFENCLWNFLVSGVPPEMSGQKGNANATRQQPRFIQIPTL